MRKRCAENTGKATKLWVDCFKDYLSEKNLPAIDLLTLETLPQVLADFYTELKKKEKSPKKKCSNSDINEEQSEASALNAKTKENTPECEYKNSTMNCIRAALNRHFKETIGIDIIKNEAFTKTNEMFRGVTKQGRREGRGDITSKEPITDLDMEKLSSYFVVNMQGPVSGKLLQEVVLFQIIYTMGRRGRENLRQMTKETFQIDEDPKDGRKFIFQAISEYDKNHTEKDTIKGNEGRIYQLPGELLNFIC